LADPAPSVEADVGFEVTEGSWSGCAEPRRGVAVKAVNPAAVVKLVHDEIAALLGGTKQDSTSRPSGPPSSCWSGCRARESNHAAKLARRLKLEQKRPD